MATNPFAPKYAFRGNENMLQGYEYTNPKTGEKSLMTPEQYKGIALGSTHYVDPNTGYIAMGGSGGSSVNDPTFQNNNKRQTELLDFIEKNKAKIGQPDRPTWESLLGPDGRMKSQYQVSTAMPQASYNEMSKLALRSPGTASQWGQLQQKELTNQAGQAMSNAQRQGSYAMNQAAMRGGIGSGSMERLAGQNTQQGLMARQGILGAGRDIKLQDENMRLQQLGALANEDFRRSSLQTDREKYNISNALGDVSQRRMEDMNAYNERMRAWAAERTANAAPSSSGSSGGGFLSSFGDVFKVAAPTFNPASWF